MGRRRHIKAVTGVNGLCECYRVPPAIASVFGSRTHAGDLLASILTMYQRRHPPPILGIKGIEPIIILEMRRVRILWGAVDDSAIMLHSIQVRTDHSARDKMCRDQVNDPAVVAKGARGRIGDVNLLAAISRVENGVFRTDDATA